MAFAFQIKGLGEFLKSMDNMPNQIKQQLDIELTTTAFAIEADAKKLAPVDLGNLVNNIRVTRNEPLLKWISSEAEYSAYVEFGTGTNVTIWPGFQDLEGYALQFKGEGKQGKHPVKFRDGTWRMVPYQLNLRARPFFFPSFQVHTAGLLDRLKKIIEEDAKK